MFKALLLFAAFFISSQTLIPASAHAADEDVVIEKKPEAEVTPKNSVVEDSSEFNRMGKTWLVDVQLLGVGPSWSSGWGLDVGYFLDRNSLVMLEVTSGKLDGKVRWNDDDNNDDIDEDGYEIRTKSIGVHYKRWVGNSFYFRGGFDYRTVDFEYDFVAAAKFKGKSFGFTFNIGNHWQWENFNLGCDWVGITLPFGGKFSDESLTPGAFYTADEFDKDKDIMVKDVTLNLLRFYLGASF